MAVVSIRFNEKEMKILKKLSTELDLDQSTIIKESLCDSYEDLVDRGVIEKFEKLEKRIGHKFVTYDQVIK